MGWLKDLCTRFPGVACNWLSHLVLSAHVDAAAASSKRGGVVALILLGSGWIVGYVTDVRWLQQAAVVAMLPGLMWAILGKEVVRTLLWPLGFLVFMLPVGTSIEPWLQDLTGWFIQVGFR